MYNEDNRIVSIFKDYLILDDLTEFLKRSYDMKEWKERLPKILKFYQSYTNWYPNYAVLPENKYIFKNFSKKQKVIEEIKQRKLQKQQKEQAKPAEDQNFNEINSIISDDKLFDNKFIEEVKNMSVLKENKHYSRMKFSSVISSFLQNSSLMIGNNTMQSIINKSQASMFSKMTSSSKMIPQEQLNKLEEEPDWKFSVQILQQRLRGIQIADADTTKKAITTIQNKLMKMKILRENSIKLSKKEEFVNKMDKKIVIRTSKDKLFQKGSKRISIDHTDKFIKTINKLKSRNSVLTQKTDVLPSSKAEVNLKEKGWNRSKYVEIENTQPLPVHFPHTESRYDIPRPDSQMSNIIPKHLRRNHNSKIRISLKSIMSSEDKINYWGNILFNNHHSTKHQSSLSEKTQDLFKSKNVVIKDKSKVYEKPELHTQQSLSNTIGSALKHNFVSKTMADNLDFNSSIKQGHSLSSSHQNVLSLKQNSTTKIKPRRVTKLIKHFRDEQNNVSSIRTSKKSMQISLKEKSVRNYYVFDHGWSLIIHRFDLKLSKIGCVKLSQLEDREEAERPPEQVQHKVQRAEH